MLQVVRGIYEDEKIVLEEEPVLKRKMSVIVAFLDEKDALKKNLKTKRKLGILKGKVTIPENFNEPIEELKEYMY